MPVRIMDPKKLSQRLKETGFTEIQAEAVLGVLRENLDMETTRSSVWTEMAGFAKSSA